MTVLSGKQIFTEDFNKYDFIVPLNYEEMSFCRNYSGQAKVICADEKTIALLDDKSKFYVWLINNGFEENNPLIYFVKKNSHPPCHVSPIKYPAILKPITSHSGIGVRILKNEQRLKTTDKNFIIQEYIVSPEHYVAHFYVKDGVVKWNITFVAKNPKFHIKKGAIKNYNDTYIGLERTELFTSIFQKLNYNGFACCDFKIKDGVIKIFEINARIGGSLLENKKFYHDAMNAMVEANQLQEA